VRTVRSVRTAPQRLPAEVKEPGSRRLRVMEAKKDIIHEAALEIFSQYGFYGSSLDQIADLADVSKTNLLYYFGSKEDLYLSVLRRLLHIWLEPLRSFDADQEPLQAIREYLRVKIAYSRNHPKASRLFCFEVMHGAPLLKDELEGGLRELVEQKTAVIRRWIEAGRLAPVDPYHLIFAMWATTQHYADYAVQIQALLGKTLSDDEFLEEATRNIQKIILEGIAPR
jgi:TetR/AcrR family transcriptional regulator